MSEEPLKQCPFCGAEADIVELKMTDTSLWDITCIGVECPVVPNVGATEELHEAIKAWNTRAVKPMTMGG
jgi:hypothetical protein